MHRYVLILVFCDIVITSSASPTTPFDTIVPRNLNLNERPSGWETEPTGGRGTYSLVHGCFTTLLLCAWTAIHLNIPYKTSLLRDFMQRIGWMLVAIFFPEAVLYCAWDQFWAAKTLRTEVNRIGQNLEGRLLKTNFVGYRDTECDLCSRHRVMRTQLASPPRLVFCHLLPYEASKFKP